MNVEIEVEAYVNPTEDPLKVEAAIKNLLGDIAIEREKKEDGMVLRGHLRGIGSLENFREILRRDRVRDAARAHLTSRIEGDTLRFGLNRQAAYMKRISFHHPREAPLGPILVTVRGEASRIIDFLCGKEP
ncbi:MAG: RNA-binding domain-containing protein [Candidatus Bathyarchaeia archaeon]|nr:hypothetical protein [Candidatus Bathyarchaeota archaeon]